MLLSLLTFSIFIGVVCTSSESGKFVSKPFVAWTGHDSSFSGSVEDIDVADKNVVWIVQPGSLSVRDLSLAGKAETLRTWISEAKSFYTLPTKLTYEEDGNWIKALVNQGK